MKAINILLLFINNNEHGCSLCQRINGSTTVNFISKACVVGGCNGRLN